MGHHIFAIKMENVPSMQFAAFFAQLLFIATLPIVKLSICISYRDIFQSHRASRLLINFVAVFLMLLGISLLAVSIFQCSPVNAFWTELENRALHCRDIIAAYYVNGVGNIVSDIILMGVAVPRILALQMPQRQKVALLCVVSLGWLAVVAGLVRMVRTARMARINPDPTWDATDTIIWIAVETNVSIFCAAAPYTKPLLSRLMPGLLGASTRNHINSNESATTRIELPKQFRSSVSSPGVPPADAGTFGATYAETGKWKSLGADGESMEGLTTEARAQSSGTPIGSSRAFDAKLP